MKEEIFRKKSLERVNSPEDLDDYIQVSEPSIWLLIISVIVLLAGACVWGMTASVDSTVPATVYVEADRAYCCIAAENMGRVGTGLRVKYADTEAVISGIGEKTEAGYICELRGEMFPTDGSYEGKVVVRSGSPLTLILNRGF